MCLKSRIKFPNTLSFRLTLWYASTFVVVSLTALLILYLSIDSILSDRMDEDLQEDVAEFKLLFDSAGIDRIQQEIVRELKSDDSSKIFIRLLNIEGEQLFSSDLSHWMELRSDNFPHRLPAPGKPVLESARFTKQECSTRMIYGLLDNNTILHIGESLESKEEIMELLFMTITILSCILIPIVSGIGWFMARRAVSGIEEVSRAAVDIEHGEFDRRVSIKAQGDEVQKLADTFNSMAERIRTLITEMREMTDNIAHDLRSPLARIRAISEGVLSATDNSKDSSKAAADTLEECDRLIQLINTMLDVAEIEAGVTPCVQENFDLCDLAKDACELFEPVAEQKSINLIHTLEPDCQFRGNRHNLQRMLANLLDNALKYTPKEGEVSLHLTADEQEVNIVVSDTGIGIPDSEQEQIFERFFRCDQSRSQDGCGLGLSFARAVVCAHGGEIKVSSIPKQSSIFTITFPVPCFR